MYVLEGVLSKLLLDNSSFSAPPPPTPPPDNYCTVPYSCDRSTIILLQISTAGFVKRPGRVFLLLASHLIAFLFVAGHLSKLSPFVSERVQYSLISRLFDIQFL